MSESEFETILLVDDDPNDVFAIRRLFRKQGVLNPLQTVSNGEDAMAYLSGEGIFADRLRFPYPFLLMLDLRMPGMSGWDVLEWLKMEERQPHKIVVLTGFDVAHIKEAYVLGSHSFLFKPLNFAEFSHLMNTMDGVEMRQTEGGCYLESVALDEAGTEQN